MVQFSHSVSNVNDAVVYDSLSEALRRNALILYAGAGVSAQAATSTGEHPPLWPGFLHGVVDWCVMEGLIRQGEAIRVHALINQGLLADMADSLIECLNEACELQRCFSDVLHAHKAVVGDVHRLMARLPFRAYLTSNVEDLMEVGYAVVHARALPRFYESTAYGAMAALRNGDPFVLKVHGDISNPETLVLGRRQFDRVLHCSSHYEHVLTTMASMYNILFIGCGNLDPHIEHIMGKVAAFSGRTKRHWFLAPRGSISEGRAEDLWRNKGIQVVEYKKDASYSGVPLFLKRLKKWTERPFRVLDAPEQTPQIALENEGREKQA